jgi:tetratricopeptide (TPR) repeat protein
MSRPAYQAAPGAALCAALFFGVLLAQDTPPLQQGDASVAAGHPPPADLEGWLRVGEARMLRYRDTLDLSLVQKARDAFTRAWEMDANSADAAAGLAWACNTEHDFDAGIRWARKALEIDPDNDRAESLLGDAAVELGRYDEALEHFQRALDLRPGLSSYSRAAHLLFLTGDARRATWMMQKAIDAGDPSGEETAWCRAQLATMLFETGALTPADQTAEQGLLFAPENPHLLTVMGRIRLAKGQPGEAEVCYTKSLDKVQTHEALAGLTALLHAAGRSDEAEEAYRRVLTFHGVPSGAESPVHKHGHAHGQLAGFYADYDRNVEEALVMAQHDYDEFPNLRAADTLAWCLYRNGRYTDALRLVRRALKEGPQHAAIHYHAGLIQAALGNKAEARKQLYQALSINPHFDPVHAPRASALLQDPGWGGPQISPGATEQE